MSKRRLLFSFFVLVLIGRAGPLAAANEISITLADDTEIAVTTYPAQGDYLMLWLAPEYDFRRAHRLLAESMPAEGIEVWQASITDALFLPAGAVSLRGLDGNYIADLIESAHRISGKKVFIVGDSYAAPNALLGAHRWQSRGHDASYLVGAILFTPYAYASIPSLGLAPEYLPEVEATNIPIMLYQASKSGTMGQFDTLLQKLRRHGSPVYTRMLPDVMSLFYEKPPSAAMLAAAEPVPANIRQMLPLLATHSLPTKPPSLQRRVAGDSGIDFVLREFEGRPRPGAIDLRDIEGRHIVRNDFHDRVTLVNFWASWCAPCVEEIPSLNRLQQKMSGRPFELISINYAEDKTTIEEFMRRVQVDFPVLLDRDGAMSKRWNVIAFPSTFVIGPGGRIRYGVNAAIEWDDPGLLQTLNDLLN